MKDTSFVGEVDTATDLGADMPKGGKQLGAMYGEGKQLGVDDKPAGKVLGDGQGSVRTGTKNY